jgi:hypothetical protein
MVSSSSVAGALAVLPPNDAPRVIQQFTSIFLVSRHGMLWRVYDSETSDGSGRRMPYGASTCKARLFVALATRPETRLHVFAPGEDHDISPHSLQQQLDESRLV